MDVSKNSGNSSGINSVFANCNVKRINSRSVSACQWRQANWRLSIYNFFGTSTVKKYLGLSNVTTAQGERVKGYGRIEVYLYGVLREVLLIKKCQDLHVGSCDNDLLDFKKYQLPRPKRRIKCRWLFCSYWLSKNIYVRCPTIQWTWGRNSDFVWALSVKLKRAFWRFRPTSFQPLCFSCRWKLKFGWKNFLQIFLRSLTCKFRECRGEKA